MDADYNPAAPVDQVAETLGKAAGGPALGRVEMIVVRPSPGRRITPREIRLDPTFGVEGDRWSHAASPNRESQLTLISSDALEMASSDRSRWPLAGDNFVVSMDLSVDKLPAGQRLKMGEAVIEVSETPHTGCSKFRDRFGADILRIFNSPDGRRRRLRGLNAKVLEGGLVHVGDAVTNA